MAEDTKPAEKPASQALSEGRPLPPQNGATTARRWTRLPLPSAPAYACAALSGVLYWLAFAGMDVWPLAFIALVPLWIALQGQAPRRALALGTLAGFTMNVCGFYWLQEMLKTFSGFPAVVCFFFVAVVCTYQGGRIGLLGWLYARASARGWPASLVFIAAFVASELVYPLLFPWYYAATVHQIPLLTQTAELGGPIFVGVVLVAANLAIAELPLARLANRKLDLRIVVGGAATLTLAILFGAIRIRAVTAQAKASEPVKVGMVQANMGLMEKRQDPFEGMTRHLRATDELRREGVDFVIWSETSAMRPLREEEIARAVPNEIGRRLGLPAIFGAVLVKPHPDPRRRYVFFNSAISTDARGEVDGRYDKEFLLAFGEYLPFGDAFPALYEASPNSGRFSPGTELSPLFVDVHGKHHPVAMLICYEDILPAFTNDAVRATHPELLVNMTNDAWFGDSSEPWEHLALAQFRAIEHRRYLVRSTNSGVSAVIDPVGRVVSHTDTFREETTSATIAWMNGGTAYEKLGNSLWYLVTLAVAVGAFVRRRGPGAQLG